MYLPRHFAQTDAAALHALMRERPLAMLIVPTPDGPTADLLPLELDVAADGRATLRGHVARANPLWRHAGAPVLAVFQGPQAYVSPGWYASKREDGKVVPTWNYTMVQARGPLRAVEDALWLHALVSRLTEHHEAPQPAPWAVTDAPDDFVQPMLRAIVGIEIAVESLQGKWKLSQNRSADDRRGVADGLAAQPDAGAQALAMQLRDTPGPGG